MLEKNAVELWAEKFFQSRDRGLADFFMLSSLAFEKNAEKRNHTPVVYYNDVENFINYVSTERTKKSDRIGIKFGVDGGGGFFKVCLTTYDKNYTEKTHKIKCWIS